MVVIQGTRLAQVSELRRGDVAALFADSASLQRIRFADDLGRDLVRVEWDNGPGSKVWVRCMPASNKVQIAEGSH
jgi:hypothetical protein